MKQMKIGEEYKSNPAEKQLSLEKEEYEMTESVRLIPDYMTWK